MLSGYETVLAAFAPMVETHELPRDFETIGVVFERKNRLARDLLRREVERLTAGNFRFLEQPLDGGRVSVLIGFPRNDAEKVRAFVSTAGIGDMPFPRHLRDKPFEEAFATLQEELASHRLARRVLREQMEGYFQQNAAEMIALHRLCHDHLARYDALPKFARTRHAFIIQGWVLQESLPALSRRLADTSSRTVVVRKIPGRALGSAARPVGERAAVCAPSSRCSPCSPCRSTAPSTPLSTLPRSSRPYSGSCSRTPATGPSSWRRRR